MIIKRKQFSLRERNRVKEKSRSQKEQIKERNTGEESVLEVNDFHKDRDETHLSHVRDRVERNLK